MPQQVSGEGSDEWEKAIGPDWKEKHAKFVHSLGNLTLTGFNQTLSNRGFSVKREELSKSYLHLNREVVLQTTWSIETIRLRSARLAEEFLALFPRTAAPANAANERRADRSERADVKRAFWRELLTALEKKIDVPLTAVASGQGYITIRTEFRCLRIVPWIDRPSQSYGVFASFVGEEGGRIFGQIRGERETLEKAIGLSLGLRERTTNSAPHFRVERSGEFTSPEGAASARAWLVDAIAAFRSKFVPEVGRLGATPGKLRSGDRFKLRMDWFSSLLAKARERTSLHAHCSPKPDSWVSAASGLRGIGYIYVVGQERSRIELYLWQDRTDPDKPKRRFDWFLARRAAIEAHTGPLRWERLEGRKACRVSIELLGGLKEPRERWSERQDALVAKMMEFHAAFQPLIDELGRSESAT
jgi:hypothetical protein